MKRSHKLMRLFGMLMIAGLIITACAPAATPTVAPVATTVPAATEVPAPTDAPAPTAAPAATDPPAATDVPAPTYEGMVVEAPDCDYGGEFKTMEAVDEFTVKFTLCYPDVAFPSKIAFSSFNINDTAYLESTGGSGDLIDQPNGTGPLHGVGMGPRRPHHPGGQPRLLG